MLREGLQRKARSPQSGRGLVAESPTRLSEARRGTPKKSLEETLLCKQASKIKTE